MAYERVLIGAKYQHSCKIKLITCLGTRIPFSLVNWNSQVCPPVPFKTGNSIRLIKAKAFPLAIQNIAAPLCPYHEAVQSLTATEEWDWLGTGTMPVLPLTQIYLPSL